MIARLAIPWSQCLKAFWYLIPCTVVVEVEWYGNAQALEKSSVLWWMSGKHTHHFISFSYIITEALKHFPDHVEPAFIVGHQLLWHSCFHILMHESHIPMHVYISLIGRGIIKYEWLYVKWKCTMSMKRYMLLASLIHLVRGDSLWYEIVASSMIPRHR